MMRQLTMTTLFVLFASLAACSWISPYQPNIQQGNLLSEDMLSQLHIGMTKAQVAKALGNPVLENIYNDNHWPYVYTMQVNGGPIVKKHLDLYFQNNRLVSMDGDYTAL